MNQLLTSLKFIEDPINYFALFGCVLEQCVVAREANRRLFEQDEIDLLEFTSNNDRIMAAKKSAIKQHLDWTVRQITKSPTKHTKKSIVMSIYSDIFGLEDLI